MKELTKVILISIILILGGIFAVLFSTNQIGAKFNFYKSELTINGLNVNEKLYYNPDQDYHTLFRTFVDPIEPANSTSELSNYLSINSVNCSDGAGYFQTLSGQCFDDGETSCLAYTEPNEYGCSFGNVLGFNQGQDYWIQANYQLHPDNLFLIRGKYYVKFVAYSPGSHNYLTPSNFIVSEGITNSRYFPNENALVYIPYNGNVSGFNIIQYSDFEYDRNYFFFVPYILAFVPALIFFFSWFFWGRERTYDEVPNQLSEFPNEDRKEWEVAAYFNPPFKKIDKNFFSSVLLNFYHNKIIDLKPVQEKSLFGSSKKIYVKLNGFKGDEIEKQVYDILTALKTNASKEAVQGDYFGLQKAMASWGAGIELRALGRQLQKSVNKSAKQYEESIAFPVALFSLLVVGFVSLYVFRVGFVSLYFLYFASVFIFVSVNSLSEVFVRFNKDYYIEYLKWQSFKKYLDNSFTIRTGDTQMVKLWDEYLVYSTALGVSDNVVNELKARGLIDNNHTFVYTNISTISTGFAASSGTGSHGGAGGGGVGGGGGGGR